MSLRTFGGPGRYIQGPGALPAAARTLAGWTRRVAVVADPVAREATGQALIASADAEAVELGFQDFGGECTAAEIDRQIALAREAGAGAVLAMGGGKAIDTGKGVADTLDLPLAVLPTVASNDAPTSSLIVVYDENHRVAEARRMRRSPNAVIVDTRIIAQAPARFLRAGIGDGLSKTFEARQCAISGGMNFFDGRPTLAAQALANRCWEILREDAEAALAACEAGEPDEAMERVVEAAVLLSGLGFENGGLSLTHALLRGLTAEPELAGRLHGELVAYSLLVQVELEERPAEIPEDLRGFLRRIGLPCSLADLGGPEATEALGLRIAEAALGAGYARNFQRPLEASEVAQAILRVEQASK